MFNVIVACFQSKMKIHNQDLHYFFLFHLKEVYSMYSKTNLWLKYQIVPSTKTFGNHLHWYMIVIVLHVLHLYIDIEKCVVERKDWIIWRRDRCGFKVFDFHSICKTCNE